MRILAIRGKNLASLAGEFELRFQQEPLASTGLFAICGPTGAGKSTLLDALCLALYNNTPRLAKAGGRGVNLPDVGTETLSPQAPANLLRRGAGEGYAEVDFIGNDGIEYRARWEIRRARGKTTGKLQNVEMSLKRLRDLQPLGGGKSEVQREIEQRLGLSFEQFTRAVLLAQNEFAAFLRAEDDERAQLLQTLTGLDLYEKLSKRAHARANAEQKALDALQHQLGGQQPLAAEQRAERERALQDARADATALERRQAELERHLRWHERWEELKHAERQAREAAQHAQTLQRDAASRQRYCQRVETARDARPLALELERTTAVVAADLQAVAEAETRSNETQRARQRAEDAFAFAAQAVARAEQAQTAANPDLDRAKTLDAEIGWLVPGHAAAINARAEARAVVAQTQQKLADHQAERDRARQALEKARDWLAAREPLRRLAEEWPRWDTLFQQAAKIQDESRANQRTIADLQRQEAEQRQARDRADAALVAAETALQTAETDLRTAAQALARFDPDTLASRRSRIDRYRGQLAGAEALWAALAGALARQRELESEAAQTGEKLAAADSALTRILAEKPPAAARLEQAEQSLKIAEAACAETVEALRDHLQNGSPCPVCGATEHPYALGDAPSRALLAGLQSQVETCRNALAALDRREAAERAYQQSNRQRLTELTDERKTLVDAIQRHTGGWNAHPLAEKLNAIAPADRLAWFADRNEAARRHLATLAAQETAWRQAGRARQAAQETRDRTHRQQSEARDALAAARTTFDRAVQTLHAAAIRQDEIAARLDDALKALNSVCDDQNWQRTWRGDPVAYHRGQRERATQWNGQQQRAEQLVSQLAGLDIELANLAAGIAEKTAHLHRVAADFAQLNQTLGDKRRQRQALFDGRPVAEVETALAKDLVDAKSRHLQHDRTRQAAATDKASAEAVLGQARQALTVSQRTVERAGAALADWLAGFNARHADAPLDPSQLHALLARDSAWLATEREALRQLADAARDAETTLRERQARREDHERQRASADPADALQAERANVAAALDSAKRRATEAELTLRQDDERRERSATLQNAIADQTAKTELWRKLDSLIGAADGKKFRNYAHGFTLDVLLAHANRHLADLTRRYRLERVNDTLALMVVDQDMGDEARSVHSLSGGESFLVSLALALGLASLSSNRVRVESLFIDEGFGSLDGDTLRMAMDALDQLQAQGRKVGVISHVQEMTERIGIQIQVRRQAGGRSRVEVRGG